MDWNASLISSMVGTRIERLDANSAIEVSMSSAPDGSGGESTASSPLISVASSKAAILAIAWTGRVVYVVAVNPQWA
jgi:hypothetical protein